MPKVLYWNCTAPSADYPGTVATRKLELIGEVCALAKPDIICLDEIAGNNLRDYAQFLTGYLHLKISENEGVHLNGATFCTPALKKDIFGLDNPLFFSGVGLPDDPRFQETFTTKESGDRYRVKRDLLYVRLKLDDTYYLRIWFIHANANDWNGRFACKLCRDNARASGDSEKEDPTNPSILEAFLGDFNSQCPNEVECTAPSQKQFPHFTNWKRVIDGSTKNKPGADPKLRTLKLDRQQLLYYYPYNVKDFLIASKRRLMVGREDIIGKLSPAQLHDVFSFGDHFPIVFTIDLPRVSAGSGVKRLREPEDDGYQRDPEEEERPSKRLHSMEPTPGTPTANGPAATPHDAVS
jgi:hypothetical protein